MQGLLSNLSITSPTNNHPRDILHLETLEDCLLKANSQWSETTLQFCLKVEEINRVLQELENKVERLDSLCNIVCLASRGKILAREITPLHPRRCQRDSEDSQATLSSTTSTHPPLDSCPSPSTVCVGTQTGLLDFISSMSTSLTRVDGDWIDALCRSSESLPCRTYFKDLWTVQRELAELKQLSLASADGLPSKVATKMQHFVKRKAKLESKILELTTSRDQTSKQGLLSSPSRLKAWLKRIVTSEDRPMPRQLEIVLDIDEEHCNVGREVKASRPTSMTKSYDDPLDATIDVALRSSQVVLDNARHDLGSIRGHLAAVCISLLS